MALTLDQMRTFVRSHLDLEVEDLPDTLLDGFVREGTHRVERAEPRWPFYQKYYATTLGVDATNRYPISNLPDGDCDQVAGIQIVGSTFLPLKWIGFDAFQQLQSRGPAALGRPRYWTEWQGFLSFYPALDTNYDFTVRGYRKPADWVAAGAGGTPDMPEELHNTVQLWALAKSYAQQEDPELSALYERQFSDELNEFRRRLTITPMAQPLVMNGGALRRGENMLARPKWAWELD